MVTHSVFGINSKEGLVVCNYDRVASLRSSKLGSQKIHLMLSLVEEDSQYNKSDQKKASKDGKNSHSSVRLPIIVVPRFSNTDWTRLCVAILSVAAIACSALVVCFTNWPRAAIYGNNHLVGLLWIAKELVSWGCIAGGESLCLRQTSSIVAFSWLAGLAKLALDLITAIHWVGNSSVLWFLFKLIVIEWNIAAWLLLESGQAWCIIALTASTGHISWARDTRAPIFSVRFSQDGFTWITVRQEDIGWIAILVRASGIIAVQFFLMIKSALCCRIALCSEAAILRFSNAPASISIIEWLISSCLIAEIVLV